MKSHIICHRYGKAFKKECELKKHKVLAHISKSYSENVVIEDSTTTCEDCGHIAETRKSQDRESIWLKEKEKGEILKRKKENRDKQKKQYFAR